MESRSGEWPLAVLADADPKVIAFFAQPPTVSLEIKDAAGRVQSRTRYTNDLLVVTETEVISQQVRDLVALSDASLKNPFQFYLDEHDMSWHYRAADEAFAALGIRHAIIDNSSIPSVLVRNLRFLEDYAKEEAKPLERHKAEDIANFVRAERFVEMRQLLGAGFESDDVYKSLISKDVYVDLTTQLIDATSELFLYSDRATFEAHQFVQNTSLQNVVPVPGRAWIRVGGLLKYQGVKYHVVLVGERDVLVRNDSGVESTLPLAALQNLHQAGQLATDALSSKSDERQLSDYSDRELARAMKRLKALENPAESGYSERQLRLYRAKTQFAKNPLEALIALTDRQAERGNFSPRLSETTIELMHKAIDKRFNTPAMPKIKAAYKPYIISCEKHVAEDGRPDPQIPASYTKFCRESKKRADIGKRQGNRMRYQKSRIVTSLDNAYPVHGVRPHEVLHIDHTIATLATISPNGTPLGKPTLTIGIDACTTSCRAVISSYDPPTARLVLLLMRDYVRRWGRLPKTIVVDNGKEFHSAEFTFFCSLFNIEIRYRSPGMPRSGSPVERAFLAIETGFIAQLEGNTRQLRDPRLVTAPVNGFNLASWTLTAFHRAAEQFLFEIRPNEVSPALGMTPRDYEAMRMQETGTREHMLVRYDENLMLMTSPHPHRRLHRLDPQRGVWVGGLWFNHSDFRGLPEKSKLEVRVEPWLHRVVYVCIGKRWVTATASNARWLGNRTRREVEIALRAEKRKANKDANKNALSLESAEAHEQIREPLEFDERLSCQQAEMLHLYTQYGLTLALPDAVPHTIDAAATSTVVTPESSNTIVIPGPTPPPFAGSYEPPPSLDSDGLDADGWH
ncbi:hypothetical protein ASF45_26430 [Pseudorhodoferax sp. Leaf265]|nr:hypothetical protein ASF45_26430 [Pseudorhodoferax sp. Leaf265]